MTGTPTIRAQALLAGALTYGIGVMPPLYLHLASGAGGFGHFNRTALLAVGLLTMVPFGVVFGSQVYRHLRVAERYASRRPSEAWAALFAGAAIFGMLASLLPFVLWWRMVNDDTAISDRGVWFFLAWVVGYTVAATVGVAAASALFGARKAVRDGAEEPVGARHPE